MIEFRHRTIDKGASTGGLFFPFPFVFTFVLEEQTLELSPDGFEPWRIGRERAAA